MSSRDGNEKFGPGAISAAEKAKGGGGGLPTPPPRPGAVRAVAAAAQAAAANFAAAGPQQTAAAAAAPAAPLGHEVTRVRDAASASRPAAASAELPFRLSYKQSKKTDEGPEGAYRVTGEFKVTPNPGVSPAQTDMSGYVVQRVTRERKVFPRSSDSSSSSPPVEMSLPQLDAHTGPDYPNNFTRKYYEAFETGKNGEPKHADQFASTGFVSAAARAKSDTDPNWNAAHSTTSGESTQEGRASFYAKSKGMKLPVSEEIPEANGLPSWTYNPFATRAPDSNGVVRSAIVKWGPPTSHDPYTSADYPHRETNDRNFAASPGGPDSSGSPASSSQSPQRLPVLQLPAAAATQSAFQPFTKHQHSPQHQAATSPSAPAPASAASHPEAMTARPDPRRSMAMPAEARTQDRADAFAARNAGAASAAAAATPAAASSSADARTARSEARRAAAAPAAAAVADVEMAPADVPRAKHPRSLGSSESDAKRQRRLPSDSESAGRPTPRK